MKPYVDLKEMPPNPAKVLEGSPLMDVSEFGRAVHAEMDAITSCARTGSSCSGGELFTTTFPCHNCTRHLIASGIRRVVYIEPYPKSMAFELHDDAVFHTARNKKNKANAGKIPFEPFVGVGPRKFMDLFSMKLSRGLEMKRKKQGDLIDWKHREAILRFQMLPTSYLEREQLIAERVKKSTDRITKQESLRYE